MIVPTFSDLPIAHTSNSGINQIAWMAVFQELLLLKGDAKKMSQQL